MKPYYEHADITIYHGDCREILPTLPKCDLLLTDPPYGINGGVGGDSRKFGKGKYGSDLWEDTPDYIRAAVIPAIRCALEVCARGIVTCGSRNIAIYPPPDDIGCFWMPASCTHGPWGFNNFQPVLYYGRDPRSGIGSWPSGLSVTEASEKNGHPCPKPYKAWSWLLKKGSILGGETILDPFMGSGTTLVAAKNLGRKAIGIEIEEKYCEIAAKRLSQEVFDFEGVNVCAK